MFLLVLQPEYFTEEHKQRLESILESFSDQSFDHSIVLISEPREESSGSVEQFVQHPVLKDIIQKCKVKMLLKKSFERQELLTVMGEMLEELKGEHVTGDVYEEAFQRLPAALQTKVQQESKLHENSEPAHPLRIVLFGKSNDKKSTLGNIIIQKTEFHPPKLFSYKQCVSASGTWNRKPVTVIKTPDFSSLSFEKVRQEMKNCVSLCHPGPNVLLLLVKPTEFTEDDRKTLKFLLSLFDQDAFKHSMILITHDERGQNLSVEQLIKHCRQSHFLDSKENQVYERQELMQKIETIVCENKGEYLKLKEGDDSVMVFNESKPVLNLILFGRRGAGKTSVVDAILRSSRFGPQPDPSQCVKTQGEVGGRWVSLLELPALCGKPEEAAKESFRCVSLCDPEGVHAFILVLPVAPLTDEDKGELQIIQDTFSPRVKDFIMILFTVDSDPADPAVLNFIKETKEIQELCQSCGGRYFVLNVKDKKQIPQLLETVDQTGSESSRGFTKETFTRANMERVLKLQADLQDVRHKVDTDSELRGRLEEKEEEMRNKEEEMKNKEEEMK
ncbi:GTPase IMAP family member 8, partial [Austrofundulus limnaeus]|uniref:GTPase IMAP family member 8 n=1 Tax=Austrofundulus limnaeus TaxID=52670 RepID=A0A2I4CS38_AUSLI